MSSDLWLLVIFIVVAIGVSLLCSIAEAVLLSITPSFVEDLKRKNPRRAAILVKLRQEKVDRSLAAILTMNTIAHTAGAIGAGAQADKVFGTTWVTLFSVFMTLAILFISEIIPKTLGTLYWKQLTAPTIFYIQLLIYTLYPLVWASEFLTKLISRGKVAHTFSRDEFVAMAGMGEKSGDLDRHESKIIRNLFRFRSLKVTDIMTPRTVISAFPMNLTVGQTQDVKFHNNFSRIPVYDKDLDDIKGFVLKNEILLKKSQGDTETMLSALIREIKAVPDSMSLPRLLEFFLDSRLHIALVLDEFGGTKGIVTLEDVLETLLGMEIVDEMDKVTDMQSLARRQWIKRMRSLGLENPEELLNQSLKKKPSAT